MYKVFPHNSHSFLPAREDSSIVTLDIFLVFESSIFLTPVLTHNQANFF